MEERALFQLQTSFVRQMERCFCCDELVCVLLSLSVSIRDEVRAMPQRPYRSRIIYAYTDTRMRINYLNP